MCDHRGNDCTDSREHGVTQRRRRKCKSCGHKWATREIPEKDWQAMKMLISARKEILASLGDAHKRIEEIEI